MTDQQYRGILAAIETAADRVIKAINRQGLEQVKYNQETIDRDSDDKSSVCDRLAHFDRGLPGNLPDIS